MPDLFIVDRDRSVDAYARTVATDDWRASIELSGEIDLSRADGLEQYLTAHLDAGRRVLRVDTERLAFIDCSALTVLVRIDTQCRERRGSLILSGVPGHLRRLMAVLGLDSVLLVDCAERPDDDPADRPVAATG